MILKKLMIFRSYFIKHFLSPLIFITCLFIHYSGNAVHTLFNEEPFLNLYTWFDVIPQDVLKQFEQEYGIKINNDVFDSNEILEAKLLTGNSGYDVVTPSVFPYLSRQIDAKLYQSLNKNLLPNCVSLDPLIMEHFSKADLTNNYAIPLTWGLVGFAYDEKKIMDLAPNAPTNSWAMFYDPQTVKSLSKCHISVLEEGNEVITPLFIYLGFDSITNDKQQLLQTLLRLKEIRPSITRFDVLRSNDEIFSGHVCLVMHWVGTLERTKTMLGNFDMSNNIKIVVPREGTVLWIDALGIPKSAPHPHNAHLFINFLMRPEIIARVTNYTFFANAVPSSKAYINREIVDNMNIYPPLENFKKFHVNQSPSLNYYRMINRMMLKFRMNWFD